MRTRIGRWAVTAALALTAAGAVGCPKNPLKRDPVNVFPGQAGYDRRAATLSINEEQAFARAYEAARRQGRTEYVSRRPTVIHGKMYVFSIPQAQGASLKGYHVNGETSEVLWYNKDETVVIK